MQPHAQSPAQSPAASDAPASKSLFARLLPNRAPKTAKAPKPAAAVAGEASDSGFRRGLLLGALCGVVVTFAGLQLLGGSDPVSVSPAPPPYADAQPPATDTFLDQSLATQASLNGAAPVAPLEGSGGGL